MAIRVELESQKGTSNEPARVLIYENDKLIAEIIAKVEMKLGADYGKYPCVELVQK